MACIGALAALLWSTAESDPAALWVFGAMLAAALAFELTYPRLVGRPLRIHPDEQR